MDRVHIFAWTKSAFRCGSVVSSRALKTGMCSGLDRVQIFAWTESAFWCGSVVSSRALKTGMCSGVDQVRIFVWTESAFWSGSVVLSRALKMGMFFGWPLGGGGGGGFIKINHATSSKLYRSYYPHRTRELVSPVCGIFSEKKERKKCNFVSFAILKIVSVHF